MSSLTGLVLTYNGERLLARCLDSLHFCERILVIDSFSTDKTEAIARAASCIFVQRKWEGPAPQFSYAFELLRTMGATWVVSLDQDELCSPTLRDAVLQATAEADQSGKTLAGFWVSRRSWYYDRFLLHSGWYPDKLLRIFRAGYMRVNVNGAHYSFHPVGDTRYIDGDILHYPYSSFREHLDKINSYAQQGAEALAARGKRGGVLAGIVHGLGRFLRIYVLKKGFLDGRAGFINAAHGSFYAFLKYVRVNETTWGAPYTHR